MEITQVKIFPVQEDKLKAFVSVVFDHCFMVNDIKIIRGRQGLFISMPSRKKKNGEFKDVAHPLNNETRQRIEGLVLAEYERALEERDRAEQGPAEQDGDASGKNLGKKKTRPQPRNQPAPPVKSRETSREKTRERKASPEGETEEEETAEKTLEEVEEMHLRDSFWTVP